MNNEEFIALVENPDELKKSDFEGLNEFVSQFPYFQTAHMLIAKQKVRDNDIEADNYLGKAAAYAGNRQKLFELVSPLFTETPPGKDIKIPVSQKDQVEVKENEVLIEPAPQDVLPEETKADQEELPDNKIQIEDKEIKRSFTEWLNILKEGEEPRPKQPDKPEIKVDPVDESERSSEQFEEVSQVAKLDLHPGKILSPTEEEMGIIKKFVATNKEKQKKGPAKANLKEEAISSVEENEDIISDTLAQLLVLQGETEKAIQVYEKLILQNPEKSTYFADRIKKLGK